MKKLVKSSVFAGTGKLSRELTSQLVMEGFDEKAIFSSYAFALRDRLLEHTGAFKG
jgi:hypothetical protein